LFIRNCAPKSSDFEESFLKITISCTLSCPSRLIKRRKFCRLHYIHRQTNTPFMILFIFRCVISVVLESITHTNHHFLVKCIITILGLLVASSIAKLLHTLWMHKKIEKNLKVINSFSPEKFTCSKVSSGIWGCYDLSFKTVWVPYHVFVQDSTITLIIP
jgi:hypothetical protein